MLENYVALLALGAIACGLLALRCLARTTRHATRYDYAEMAGPPTPRDNFRMRTPLVRNHHNRRPHKHV